MLIGDLFERDVTRAIPPVVYFHEQEPAELKREVEEYIITGGYPARDPRATEGGIHEQFVRLLTAMHRELQKPGGPELPACWISGFYGSGKSSFAKLLGLSLDGRTLPGGRPLAEALLAQDHSPGAPDLRAAWQRMVSGIQPVAVVFDVGSKARDDEHIHAVVVRQLQHRLGYSTTSNLVAEYELKLELEGLHAGFMDKVLEVHRKPWGQLKDSQLVEDYFSAALHALQPDLFTHSMAWVDSRSGSRFEGKRSADEAVQAIQHMMDQRCPGRTLFFVVDEVSQYVHDDDDRMLALQSFVAALGQRMKGKAWLLATGQQKLEEGTGVAAPILKLKDRFPPSLRVHLGTSNIRDVVHKRLLRKKRLLEPDLKGLFHAHRSEIALYAYRGDEISETDFVEIYPMLPGHIDLLLDITTGLRSRSARTQGDAHAIRGLLQLLGDLFRERDLARYEVGRLITLDLIYDVLHSALDNGVQMTITRALDLCSRRESPLMARVVKAVALLELVQDHQKTSAELVARCLYEVLGQGNLLPEVQKALDVLVGEGLLGYSEKTGYKIESSAGQEWQRERDGYAPSAEQLSEKIARALEQLLGGVDKPTLQGTSIPWLALFSDSVRAKDVHIKDERKHTVVTVDFQFTKGAGAEQWVPRSDTQAYRDRIVWVVGSVDAVQHAARKLVRSERMIELNSHRQGTPGDERHRLLMDERTRLEAAQRELAEAVKGAFMAGQLYFRGRERSPRDVGATFSAALAAFAGQIVSELYPHPMMLSVSEKEILYLIENAELTAPPPVLGQERLGLLSLDAGRYEVTCTGRVPTDILAYVREHGGITGSTLLAHFGAPPHGVAPDVVRAAVVGLLRGRKVRIEIAGIGEITSPRDEGARELLKEAGLRKAKLTENTVEALTPRDRNAICALFRDLLGKDVARDNDAIADAVAERFARVRERLTELGERFRRLPKDTAYPATLTRLEGALEACRRDRRVEPTVLAVKRSLNVLRDGLTLLRRMETDLTDGAIDVLRQAEDALNHTWPGLAALSPSEDARAAAGAVEAHLRAERPWEDTAELQPRVELLRGEYRARRRALLDAHAREVDLAVERLKRRSGFERLDPDQRHQVLRHLREGAAPNTDERAVAPALEVLEGLLAARREAAEARALAQLDTLLEGLGATPVVEVALDLGGREIDSAAALDRLLDEIRRRVLHELDARHRVRLR
ncbi:hypothetical protein SOCEGT47_029290 [Sorangium cellulosum]|uniref:BREX system P-loop protein BrxC n=1 Tax=Sorangium cellulosum TaxID=56 RepID=A0A4P2Q0K9_SORCE|nr:BREX system P-loop protein BrxC [Sorangium cellulosum]AUX22426.1 hypothetical protein SOCEGT47_029290 [Sorangium cellulosum]